jgi:hypothetical protein
MNVCKVARDGVPVQSLMVLAPQHRKLGLFGGALIHKEKPEALPQADLFSTG